MPWECSTPVGQRTLRAVSACHLRVVLSQFCDTLCGVAIPGITPELPLRAKVRVGAKNAKGYPVSLDHFVSDDTDFPGLAGAKPVTLRIRFPYQTVNENFPSGLEKWMKRKNKPGNILGCYTKGDGLAHRLGKEKSADGLVILDPTPGSERLAMPCAAQACPYYGKEPSKGCRPIARLNFFLVGDPRVDSVWRFETKSLNTYEAISAVLAQYNDLRQHVFLLTARRVKQGTKEFTVVDLAEDTPTPTPAASGEPAAGTAAGAGESQAGPPEPASSPADTLDADRQRCKEALVSLGQWPPNEATVAWIGACGPTACADALEQRIREQHG